MDEARPMMPEAMDQQAMFDAWDAFDATAAMDDQVPDEYIPTIRKPDPDAAAPQAPRLSADERIELLLDGIPGMRKLLLHVIDWCRDERTEAQIESEVLDYHHGPLGVYSPSLLLTKLTAAGALIRCDEGQGEADAGDGALATGDGDDPAVGARPTMEATGAMATDDGGAGSAAGEDADELIDPTAAGGTDDGFEIEYLEVQDTVDRRYLATPEGIAAVEADKPTDAFALYLEEYPQYQPVFADIVRACIGGGTNKAGIDALVDHNPACEKPRRWAGYFIDRLEEADAIHFGGSWKATTTGEAMVAPGGLLNPDTDPE